MALPTSFPLSLSEIATEFGDSTPNGLFELAPSIGITSGNQVAISDFFGASAAELDNGMAYFDANGRTSGTAWRSTSSHPNHVVVHFTRTFPSVSNAAGFTTRATGNYGLLASATGTSTGDPSVSFASSPYGFVSVAGKGYAYTATSGWKASTSGSVAMGTCAMGANGGRMYIAAAVSASAAVGFTSTNTPAGWTFGGIGSGLSSAQMYAFFFYRDYASGGTISLPTISAGSSGQLLAAIAFAMSK